jgi:cytoskeletal protein RodZ
MNSLGARLKHAREARGLSLGAIAKATKISVSALEAIERDDVRKLPGGIFGRSMVRAYALAVGVDADAAVEELQTDIVRAEREHAQTKRQPEITSDDRRFLERQRRALMVLRTVVVVVVVLVVAAVAWYFLAVRGSGG